MSDLLRYSAPVIVKERSGAKLITTTVSDIYPVKIKKRHRGTKELNADGASQHAYLE